MPDQPAPEGGGGSGGLSVWDFLRFEDWFDMRETVQKSARPLRTVLGSIKASKLFETIIVGFILSIFSIVTGAIQGLFAAIGATIDSVTLFVVTLIRVVASFPIRLFGVQLYAPTGDQVRVEALGAAFQPIFSTSEQFPIATFAVVVVSVGVMMFAVGKLNRAFRGAI